MFLDFDFMFVSAFIPIDFGYGLLGFNSLNLIRVCSCFEYICIVCYSFGVFIVKFLVFVVCLESCVLFTVYLLFE